MSRGKGRRTIELVAAATKILEEIEPASVRAMCYQLFIQKLIPNMGKSSTNSVSRLLTRAREEGEIPWEWIVDESRAAETVNTWSNPDQLIAAAVRQYRRDYWQDQSVRIEVWSEKGTVRGTLRPVLDEYGVTFRVMHGYASATVVNEIADYSNDAPGKPLIALYVGDWDPSGKHMSEVDLPQRLEEYGAAVELKRIALTRTDLAGLPKFDIESKRTDPRYRWFKRNVGTPCYELVALPPPDLRSRVKKAIRARINLSKWEHARMIEKAETESMQDFRKSWQASICRGGRPLGQASIATVPRSYTTLVADSKIRYRARRWSQLVALTPCHSGPPTMDKTALPPLRASMDEASALLGLSGSILRRRVRAGELKVQRDGRRVFITTEELKRYLRAVEKRQNATV